MIEPRPNAMEVYYRDKLVGWVNDAYDTGKKDQAPILLCRTEQAYNKNGEPYRVAVEEHSFEPVPMKWSYDRFMTLDDPDGFREKLSRIPKYAIKREDPNRDTVSFEWHAIKFNSLETYEWLFDHHSFVPIDGGELDRDTEEERNPYEPLVYGGGGSALSVTCVADGAITASSTVSSSYTVSTAIPFETSSGTHS
jgi:hypothetical protein